MVTHTQIRTLLYHAEMISIHLKNYSNY